ncbi:hypothetical protein HanRHA438_Chr08g0352051 [Helianthus annuus]|nr:hypothetical protein HanRHA438_Chr08g0352051 [Helianthus annuus]
MINKNDALQIRVIRCFTCSKPSVRLAHSMSLVISKLDLERRGAIQAWKNKYTKIIHLKFMQKKL